MEIRTAGIVPESIVDGPGFRFAIFVQGCPHDCPGCHNPETHDFAGGKLSNTEDIERKIDEYPLIAGVTFSGGEPFCQPAPLAEIADFAHSRKLNVISYSGYTFEQLMEKGRSDKDIEGLLSRLDYLVDGPFVLALRSLELRYRGSSNQRILDVKRSLEEGKAVEVVL